MPSRGFPPPRHSPFPVLPVEIPTSRGHPALAVPCFAPARDPLFSSPGGPYLGGSLYSQWRQGLRCLRLARGLAEGGKSRGRARRDPRERLHFTWHGEKGQGVSLA